MNEPDEIVWKGDIARKTSNSQQNNCSDNDAPSIVKLQTLTKNEIAKTTHKKTFFEKIIEKKIARISSKVNNPTKIDRVAKDLNKKQTQSNFNWLWSILIFIGVLFLAAILTKYFGPIAGLVSLIAILILLYLILPDDLANAMGQAAIIAILNVVLQLIMSMI